MSDPITTPKAKVFADLATIIACCQRDIRRMTHFLDVEFTLINFNIAKGLLRVLANDPGPDIPDEGVRVQGASGDEVLLALRMLDQLKELRKEAEVVNARLTARVIVYAAENNLQLDDGVLGNPRAV